jgi:uncharacterized protein (TIGR00730 family)
MSNQKAASEPSQRRKDEMIRRIKASRAYSKAYEDLDFMRKKDLRPVRLQLELLKPELILREYKIRSTIVVFGSARILSRQEARLQLKEVRRLLGADPGNSALYERLKVARLRLSQSRYYEQARRFSFLISQAQAADKNLEFVIVTGGGPGIMEAANRGAYEANSKSIGLNITLPHEQNPNPYISPELSFQFHYFSLRKMHFMMRAKALVAFPGGYGTLDELFETLTLVQTGKKRSLPIVLFGRKYWKRLIDFDYLAAEGMISREDVKLFTVVEKAEEAWEHIRRFWKNQRATAPSA